jgi:hypothetical protein
MLSSEDIFQCYGLMLRYKDNFKILFSKIWLMVEFSVIVYV